MASYCTLLFAIQNSNFDFRLSCTVVPTATFSTVSDACYLWVRLHGVYVCMLNRCGRVELSECFQRYNGLHTDDRKYFALLFTFKFANVNSAFLGYFFYCHFQVHFFNWATVDLMIFPKPFRLNFNFRFVFVVLPKLNALLPNFDRYSLLKWIFVSQNRYSPSNPKISVLNVYTTTKFNFDTVCNEFPLSRHFVPHVARNKFRSSWCLWLIAAPPIAIHAKRYILNSYEPITTIRVTGKL